MNCLNKSSVGAGVGAAIKRVIGVDAEISDVGVASKLTNREAKVFTSVEVKLLKRENLLRLLADLIRSAAVSFLVTL